MSTPVNVEMLTLLNVSTFKERLHEAVADKKLTIPEARAALAKRGTGGLFVVRDVYGG